MTLLFRLYRALKYSRITLQPGALALLSKYREVTPLAVERRAGQLVLRGTNVALEPAGRHFLLQGLPLAQELTQLAGGQFSVDPAGDVLLQVQGVTLILRHWEELFVAHEIFVQGSYQWLSARPFWAVDVGMNVGTASLFFAAQPNCLGVEAFELFPQTAQRAAENFRLNPVLAKKINVVTAGLAAENGTRELDYCAEFKGSMGLYGLAEHTRPTDRPLPMERTRVTLRSAAEVFRELIARRPEIPLVCKMDCEGAEYEILAALAEAGCLSRLSLLCLEWHRQGAERAEKILTDAGFDQLSFHRHGPNFGMIYAWRPEPGPPARN